jgi:hypothetical protein
MANGVRGVNGEGGIGSFEDGAVSSEAAMRGEDRINEDEESGTLRTIRALEE